MSPKAAPAAILILLFSLFGLFASGSPNPFEGPLGLVVIDPGHGGSDPGAVANGIEEKSLNLQIALALRDELSKAGINTILTRDDDFYLGLQDRCDIANSADWPLGTTAMFVSIHANSYATSEASGLEVYTCHEDRFVPVLTSLSPSSQGFRFAALSPQEASNLRWDASASLAGNVLEAMQRAFPSMKSRGVKQDNLYVLNCTSMPSILVEVGFVSNPEEAQSMKKASFVSSMAKAICAGILSAAD